MNILVAIPNHRLEEIEAEEKDLERRLRSGEKELAYFWSLPRRPKDLEIGDRVYFIWNKAIRAWHKVIGFKNDMSCNYSGRKWFGFCVILDPTIHHIDPIPHSGFRSFRYYKNAKE